MTTKTTPNPNMPRPTPSEAIKFSLTIDDHYDRLEFLKAFDKQADMMEWIEEFSEWKNHQQ